ncbi:FG-GAP repeat domain-containing protein [Pseudodesulfovibrio sediminis]|uniref:VCBS repeat-containing protein n=1 Tax=Pseudodesulfovibrio sediminis TaxID=2810563 RepID=A0ABN6EVG9_9BACT|nr:VCBS repeat-containing protein [Pseudodesulfovibrio sediminis]BCS89542.1 hypothetical protein PSDVSF_27840 [Pseudodesulfovibrio sediminis]
MAKRHTFTALTVFMAVLIMAASAMAQGTRSFAVLPFKYNGPQKYSYYSKAFQSSLNSKLEWIGHVEQSHQNLSEVTFPANKADALNSLRALNLDHLVYGDIAILNRKAHLKLEVTSKDGNSWLQKGEMDIDEIVPWLDEQSRIIQGDIFNRPGYGTQVETKKAEAVAQQGPTASPFIQGGNDATAAATLNPQFRYEGGTSSTGRWRSQSLRYSSYSMAIADGDADGQNEVFILQKSAISAYRFKEGQLQHLTTFELPANTSNMRLEIADLNRDGLPEFVIGAYQIEKQEAIKAPRGQARSSILSFDGGKFKYIVKKYNKFLGVLRIPPTYMPILVAQKKGTRHLFDQRMYEAFIKGDTVELGQKIHTPPFGNVYNMIYMPQELGYNYVVINDSHKLVTYNQTMERLNETDATYNSSGTAIVIADLMPGMGGGVTEERKVTYNIPFHMITAPLTSDKYELLVNKDLSAAAQIFESYKYFTQGEIHSLAWDQVGLTLAWKTRRIKGQVVDIALADLNNDGDKQLVVLINTFAGIGYGNRKTVVLAYDLNM